MSISYDAAKEERNLRERKLSFELVREFDWSSAYVLEDTRKDYGERRFQALGRIGSRLHMLVFTPRGDDVTSSVCARRTHERLNGMKKRSGVNSENPEWTAADFARAKRAREVLPKLFAPKTAVAMLKPRGRPKSPKSKVAISLRVAPQVLARWKASGAGWQTRMAESLKRHAPVRREADS